MTITLTYNGNSLEVEGITTTLNVREVFHNNLKQADNSMKLSAVFTIELANFLKTHINDNVSCSVTDNGEPFFFGYVRKNIQFQKTQINQPIALEIVSPSFLLNKTMDKGRGFVSQSLEQTLTELLQGAGFNNLGDLSALSYVAPVIIAERGTNYKDIITQLLFEYGYTWDFDHEGKFFVSRLFDLPDVSEITQEFNGSNCRGSINITAKENENDSVRATYNKVERHEGALLFQNTDGAEGSYSCMLKVDAKSYWNNSQFVYLDCDSNFGKVLYIESITDAQLQADSSRISFQYSKNDLAPDTGDDLGNQICFSAYNADDYEHNISKMQFFGDVLTSQVEVENKTFGTKKTLEVSLRYICEEAKAKEFTENYTNWLRYANNNITVKSPVNYELGSFVKVSDYGIGTYYGRIVQKTTDSSLNITYVVETITEFEPAEATGKQTQGQNVLGAIEAAKENSFAYTDDRISQVELEASPRYDVQFNASIIKKTADNAYSPSVITAYSRKIVGDTEEQPYAGIFHVYINGNTAEYGLPVQGTSLSLNIADISSYVNEINQIKIVFKSASDAIVIDQEVIPVLSNSAAYSVVLDNDFNSFICDDEGKVNEETIVIRPHVYYGLSELPYGADGWSFMTLPSKEGFNISADYAEGTLTIQSIAGSVLPDYDNIGISLFIHSSVDEEFQIGYINGIARLGEEVYIGYDDNGMSVEVGYIQPAESGVFTAFFSYIKMSELGLLLKVEDDSSSPNYGDMTVNGAKIKVNSITADKIQANAITVGKLADGAVSAAKLSDGAVTKNKIGASAVGTTQIENGAITTDKLTAKAVTADQIDVESLMAEALKVGNSISSEDYEEGVRGFIILANGHAEFNDIMNRGFFTGTFQSEDFNPSTFKGMKFDKQVSGSVIGRLQGISTNYIGCWNREDLMVFAGLGVQANQSALVDFHYLGFSEGLGYPVTSIVADANHSLKNVREAIAGAIMNTNNKARWFKCSGYMNVLSSGGLSLLEFTRLNVDFTVSGGIPQVNEIRFYGYDNVMAVVKTNNETLYTSGGAVLGSFQKLFLEWL